jgi:hypothetical protein
MPMKKKWVTPKLIVLVRGNLNEKVLLTCKSALVNLGGPTGTPTGWCGSWIDGDNRNCRDFDRS